MFKLVCFLSEYLQAASLAATHPNEYTGFSTYVAGPAWEAALADGAIVLVKEWKYYKGGLAIFGKCTRDYNGCKRGDMVHTYIQSDHPYLK